MTTTATTSTTTTTTTTTTTPTLAKCNVVNGLLCDPLHEENLIIEVTHLQTVSDCQALCQNHAECRFWSHWNEEHGEHW